jgi:hypothetical protein
LLFRSCLLSQLQPRAVEVSYGLPAVGQELIELAAQHGGDASQDIAEVGDGSDRVGLAGGNRTGEARWDFLKNRGQSRMALPLRDCAPSQSGAKKLIGSRIALVIAGMGKEINKCMLGDAGSAPLTHADAGILRDGRRVVECCC